MANKTDFIGSLEKGLRVLECFGAERPRLSISDVSGLTGLDRATSRRCLLTLVHIGYCDFDGKYFSLTPRVLRLGVGALTTLPLPQIVQPWLDQLSEQIGQSCSVSILDNTEIVYLARAAQRRVMSIGLMPGSRLPAHCTSMGRVMLAALPDEEAARIVATSDLTPRTPFMTSHPDEVMAEIRTVRAQGHATVIQEVEIGLASLAVPLLTASGKTIGALNTGMAMTDTTLARMQSDYLPALLKVQESLKRSLN